MVAPEAIAQITEPSGLLGVTVQNSYHGIASGSLEAWSVEYPAGLASNARLPLTEIWRKAQEVLVVGLRDATIPEEEWAAMLRGELEARPMEFPVQIDRSEDEDGFEVFDWPEWLNPDDEIEVKVSWNPAPTAPNETAAHTAGLLESGVERGVTPDL